MARDYAIVGPGGIATQNKPGYIYVIDIPNIPSATWQILDPVKEIAGTTPSPPNVIPYQHEGGQDFLLVVVHPTQFGHLLTGYYLSASNSPASRPISPLLHLETMVRALQDAEVLAYGIIPANHVLNRIPVW